MYSLFTVCKQSVVLKTNTISCTTYSNCNNILFMHVILPEYFDLPLSSSGEFYVTRRNGIE